MPRFYYHIKDCRDFTDLQGTELPDRAAAEAEAVRFMGALLQDHADEFWSGDEWTMTVKDQDGGTLCSLTVLGHKAPTLG